MTAAPSPSSSGSETPLLPCPFCGYNDPICQEEDGKFCVICGSVECYVAVDEAYDRDAMPVFMFNEIGAAINAWNTRASSPTPQIAGGVREAKIVALIPALIERADGYLKSNDDPYSNNLVTDLASILRALSPQAQAGETHRHLCSGCKKLIENDPVRITKWMHRECLIAETAIRAVAQAVQEPRKMYDSQTGDHYVIDADGNAYEPASPPAALPAGEDAYRETVRKVAFVRETRMAEMREALERIRDFPYIGEKAAQAMALIARQALALPSTSRATPETDCEGLEELIADLRREKLDLKFRLDYMESKHGKIDWDAALPSTVLKDAAK